MDTATTLMVLLILAFMLGVLTGAVGMSVYMRKKGCSE